MTTFFYIVIVFLGSSTWDFLEFFVAVIFDGLLLIAIDDMNRLSRR